MHGGGRECGLSSSGDRVPLVWADGSEALQSQGAGAWYPLPHLPKFLRLICSPGDPYPYAFSLKKQKTQNVLNQLRVARAAPSFSPARSDSPSQAALPLLLLPKLRNVLKGCFRVCPFESPLWLTFFFSQTASRRSNSPCRRFAHVMHTLGRPEQVPPGGGGLQLPPASVSRTFPCLQRRATRNPSPAPSPDAGDHEWASASAEWPVWKSQGSGISHGARI